MARERMITRTINVKTVTAIFYDLEKEEAVKTVTTVIGNPDYRKLGKIVCKQLETDTFKIVKIISVEDKKVHYCISEADFIKYAVPVYDKVEDNEEEG